MRWRRRSAQKSDRHEQRKDSGRSGRADGDPRHQFSWNAQHGQHERTHKWNGGNQPEKTKHAQPLISLMASASRLWPR